MSESTEIITYKTLSYIQYSLYFIYLRCILFLNTIDFIIFSDILEDNNNTSKSSNNFYSKNTTHQDSFNSLSRHTEPVSSFNIFDMNRTTFLSTHTRNKINDMENLIFSDE